jgi:hypothetical protein
MPVLYVRDENNTEWLAIGSLEASEIKDADGDTKVQCEESADEDMIRFDCGGTGDVLTLSASAIAGSLVKDEDDMASDSASHVCTQQSIKAYVDAYTDTLEFIASATASSDASISFSAWDTAFYEIHIVCDRVRPATDNQQFLMQLSSDNGASWYAGTSYTYNNTTALDNGAVANSCSGTLGSAYYRLTYIGAGNVVADETGCTGIIKLLGVPSTGYTHIQIEMSNHRSDAYREHIYGGGMLMVDTTVNAVKFYFASGNISSGFFYCYGVRRA